MSRLQAAKTTLPEAKILRRYHGDEDGFDQLAETFERLFVMAFSSKEGRHEWERFKQEQKREKRARRNGKTAPAPNVPDLSALSDIDRRKIARSGGIVIPPPHGSPNP